MLETLLECPTVSELRYAQHGRLYWFLRHFDRFWVRPPVRYRITTPGPLPFTAYSTDSSRPA